MAYIQYKGSPDVFEKETGRYIPESEAQSTPNFYQQVESLDTTRPDIKNEADFARLAGTNIPTSVNTSQPAPQTVQAQPFTNQEPITPSRYQAGFEKALADGASPVPKSSGTELIQKYAPAKPNNQASLFVQSDPYVDNLVTAWQQYIDPKNQRASLADTYKQMVKDSGVEALDTELINTKNIIDGTEDDIRTEITKAGGFATESQVLALTNARNKQLIRNYNTLVETRNSKEKYLQTAISLETQDRQAADQRFESMFNMGMQVADYQQKMTNNARAQMQWLSERIGLDGIYDSTAGDPYYTGLVEKTLGLPSGGLASAAAQAKQARLQAQQSAQLELEEAKTGIEFKKEQIKTEKAQQAKIYSDISDVNTQIVDVGGRKYVVDSNTGKVVKEVVPTPQSGDTRQLAQSKGQIDLTNTILNDKNLGGAVGPNKLARFAPISKLTGGKSNFIAGVEQLRSGLNLQSLIDAKSRGATFGALSDSELQVLANTATKIGSWAIKDKNGNVKGYNANEKDFRRELDKINNFAKLDYILKGGNPSDVSVQEQTDGYWTKNSDGTMTKIYSSQKTSFNSAGKPEASKIAQAIKQVESGGNYNAKGGSGEFGAYQFMPGTWKELAQKFLGNAKASMTPANQDKVMVERVKDLLKQGYNATQIALIHNGGEPKVKKGVNKYGVKYDSGAYANKVVSALQKLS